VLTFISYLIKNARLSMGVVGLEHWMRREVVRPALSAVGVAVAAGAAVAALPASAAATGCWVTYVVQSQ
jgi:hypothetical protein